MADERVLALTLEYDGRDFAGWQVQPNVRTVQGELRDACRTLFGEDVTLHGSGRTDAGVHAVGQVASVRTTSTLSCDRIRRSLCGLTGDDVSVVSVADAAPDFHARFSATGKVYAYRVLARSSPSPLWGARSWHVPLPLERDLLAAELATLPGEADWSAYRASDCGAKHAIRTLRSATLLQHGDLLTMTFEGSGFLKQMVRVLAGTAVDVARGHLEPGAMIRIRDGRDRTAAGPTAPAHGLTLKRVLYG